MKKIIKNSLVFSLILTLAITLMFGNAPKAEAYTNFQAQSFSYDESTNTVTFAHNTIQGGTSRVTLRIYNAPMKAGTGLNPKVTVTDIPQYDNNLVLAEDKQMTLTTGFETCKWDITDVLAKARQQDKFPENGKIYLYLIDYAPTGGFNMCAALGYNTGISVNPTPTATLTGANSISLYMGEEYTSGVYSITLTDADFKRDDILEAGNLNSWTQLPAGLSCTVSVCSESTVAFQINGTAQEVGTGTLTFKIPASATVEGKEIDVAGSIGYTIIDRAQVDANTWKTTHATILGKANKHEITLADKDLIKNALDGYDKLSAEAKAKVKTEYDSLLQMKDAYDWTAEHKDIINATTVNASNEDALTAALDDLKDEFKANIPEDVLNDLNNKKAVLDGLFKQDFSDTLKKDADDFAPADLEDLKKAVEAYDELSADQQNLVDDITKAKIESARNATKWLDDNAEILDKKTVDENDLDVINKALEEYDQLDANDKKLIDPAYLDDLQNKKTAAEWADKYKDVLNKNPNELTADDIAKLNEARTEYNAFGDDVKTLIDASKLNTMIEAKANEFIEKYVSDASGTIYKTATKDNYKQILSGKAEWDKLTQAEKDAINKKLLENGGKTYEELLKVAEAIEKELAAKNGAENGVETGDETNVMVLLVLLAMSMAVIATEMKKRENLK